jgi:uncharacterized protein Yka (UPF0111/DUF47 family)
LDSIAGYDFKRSLSNAYEDFKLGKYKEAIQEYGTILEKLLEDLYKECWIQLPPESKRQILEVEEQIGRGKPTNRFTLGEWILLFNRANLFGLIEKQKKIVFKHFQPESLNKVNNLRNKCVHEGYQPTLEETKSLTDLVLSILKETKSIELDSSAIDESIKKMLFIKRLHLAIARDPKIIYDKIFYEQYIVYAEVELIGAYIATEGKITVVARIVDSTIPDIVIGETYEGIYGQIERWVKDSIPEIDEKDLDILLFDESYWKEVESLSLFA